MKIIAAAALLLSLLAAVPPNSAAKTDAALMRFEFQAALYLPPGANVNQFKATINQSLTGKRTMRTALFREQLDREGRTYWLVEVGLEAQADGEALFNEVVAEAVNKGATPPSHMWMKVVGTDGRVQQTFFWQAE